MRPAEQQRLLELIDGLEQQVRQQGSDIRPVDRASLLQALSDVETSLPDPDARRLWEIPVQERLVSDPQLARALELVENAAPAE